MCDKAAKCVSMGMTHNQKSPERTAVSLYWVLPEFKEVLFPINPKNYNFRENKNDQVMKERGNLHLNVALYTVSMVIETKIVTGWFKI